MRRHLYTAKLAKSFIERGLLGKIQSFSIAEGGIYNWPVASDFFFKRRTSGGGVLIDTGAHTLDLMLWWLGEVKAFEYFDDQIDADGVEADCLMRIVTTSGADGTLELSRTRNLRNTAVISGELADMEVSLRNNYLAVYPKNSPVICKNNVAKKSNITDLSGHKALNMGAEIRLSKDTLVGKHSIECIAEAGGSSGHIYGTRDTAIMMPAEPLTEYTVHVYLKGISGDFSEVPLLFRVGNGDFKFIKNSVVYLTDQWKRYSLTFTSGAQDDSISLGVWKRSDPTPIRWLADGFQLEKGPASGYYGPPRAPIIFDSMGPPGPQAFTSLFHDQIADFIDAINGVRAPIASGADGKLVVETIERLYEGREHMVSDWDRSNVVNVGKSK
jgi:predicted dehydrogenase